MTTSARSRFVTVFSLVTALLLILPTQATHISTFSDDQCKDSLHDIDGPNGFFNGSCEPLSSEGPYGSFQVVNLDPGCQVTIYEKDNFDQCSDTAKKQFAVIPTCYNTSWIYYSIDHCTPPSPSSTPVASIFSSPTSSSSSSSSPTNSPIATPPSEAPSTSHTGVIVGGIVGGVGGLALIAGLIFFVVRRNRKLRKQRETTAAPLSELSPVDVKHEIYTHRAAPREMGRSSIYVPPAELQGDTIEKKGDDASKMDYMARG